LIITMKHRRPAEHAEQRLGIWPSSVSISNVLEREELMSNSAAPAPRLGFEELLRVARWNVCSIVVDRALSSSSFSGGRAGPDSRFSAARL